MLFSELSGAQFSELLADNERPLVCAVQVIEQQWTP